MNSLRCSGGTRTTDEDYKIAVLEQVLKNKAVNVSTVIRVQGGPGLGHAHELQDAECAARRAALKLTIAKPSVLGAGFDCSRLGNPAAEVLSIALFDSDHKVGAWAAPQAKGISWKVVLADCLDTINLKDWKPQRPPNLPMPAGVKYP